MKLAKIRIISLLLSIAMLITMIPAISIRASEEAETVSAKHDNPWDYTVFANSLNLSVNLSAASQISIYGDIHANNNVNITSRTVVGRTIESGGETNIDTQYYRVNGGERENVSSINLPNIYDELVRSKANSSTGTDTAASGVVISGSKIEITAETVREMGLQSAEQSVIYILSEDDIVIDAASLASVRGKSWVVASENGDIVINGSDFEMAGILYAPSGKVIINDNGEIWFDGRIYASGVDVKAKYFNMTPGSNDVDMLDITDKIMFSLPPFDYEKGKDVYVYNKEAAEIDYSVYTNKQVSDISAIGAYWDEIENKFVDWRVVRASHNALDKFFSLPYTVDLGLNLLKITVKFTDGTQLNKEYRIYRMDSSYPDSDNDGLTDDEEFFLDTDKNNPDTDGDGIKDGDEHYRLFTNPLKADTDSNGKTDGNEDFDSDGLSNASELNVYGTDPLSADTDGDGLNDRYELITVYTDYDEEIGSKTNPCSDDTDGDGLSDGDEVNIYKTNPLKADTDADEIIDGVEVDCGLNPCRFDAGDAEGCVTIIQNTPEEERDENVTVSVTMRVEKESLDKGIKIENASKYNSNWNSDMAGYMGAPYNFECPENFKSAALTFTYNVLGEYSNTIEGPENEDLSAAGFYPRIYYYNESGCEWEEIPCTADRISGTVTAQVTHFSTYILLNRSCVQKAKTLAGKLLKDANNEALPNIDIALIMDSSGSMDNQAFGKYKIDAAKEFATYFCNSLTDPNDNTVFLPRISVFSFPRTEGDFCMQQALTQIKSSVTQAIDRITPYGSPSIDDSVIKAVDYLNKASEEGSKTKYILLFSDGDFVESDDQKDISDSIRLANESNIKVFTVNCGNTAFGSEQLERIASETGGEYFYVGGKSVLADGFAKILNGIHKIDKDGDGLPDYYEKHGFFTIDGSYVRTDPAMSDTDGDGLLDGEEIIMKFIGGKNKFIFKSNPLVNESISVGSVQYYTKKFISIIGGKRFYNWKEIHNSFVKDNISSNELQALGKVANSFDITLEPVSNEGEISNGLNNFKKFLETGYSNRTVYLSEDPEENILKDSFVPAAGFKKFSEYYSNIVCSINSSGEFAFSTDIEDMDSQKRHQIIKATFIQTLAKNVPSVYYNSYYKMGDGLGDFDFDFTGANFELKKYRISTNDAERPYMYKYVLTPKYLRFTDQLYCPLGKNDSFVAVYDFLYEQAGILNIFEESENKLIDKLSDGKAFKESLASLSFEVLVGKLPKNFLLSAFAFFYDGSKKLGNLVAVNEAQCIKQKIYYQKALYKMLAAANIKPVIVEFAGALQNGCYAIDNTGLQIDLNAYNYYSKKDVKLNTILSGLNSITRKGNNWSQVEKYAQWYNNNKDIAIIVYRNKLSKIFVEYCKRNPNCPYSGVDELPVSELNKLCSLYNGEVETYPYEELELEW